MLLNYYLKLKSQLTSATSVTNNYFRRASGVLALNAVAQGSGSVFTGHLEPSIWSETRSVNLSSGSVPCSVPRRLSLHPPRAAAVAYLRGCRGCPDPRRSHFGMYLWATSWVFLFAAKEKWGVQFVEVEYSNFKGERSPLLAHITIYFCFNIYFFFKAGWRPSWEKQDFCMEGGWALRHTPEFCSVL